MYANQARINITNILQIYKIISSLQNINIVLRVTFFMLDSTTPQKLSITKIYFHDF